MRTAGVLLAAGRSKRFGQDNKLLQPFPDLPLVTRAATAMRQAGFDHLIAVTADAEVAHCLEGFRLATPDPGSGMGRSLAAGIAAARAAGVERAVIALGDMPFVTAGLLARVAAAATPASPSATTDGTRITPPACFPAAVFDRLERLQDDTGAREILRGLAPDRLVRVAPEMLMDIDTPEDLVMARARAATE